MLENAATMLNSGNRRVGQGPATIDGGIGCSQPGRTTKWSSGAAGGAATMGKSRTLRNLHHQQIRVMPSRRSGAARSRSNGRRMHHRMGWCSSTAATAATAPRWQEVQTAKEICAAPALFPAPCPVLFCCCRAGAVFAANNLFPGINFARKIETS